MFLRSFITAGVCKIYAVYRVNMDYFRIRLFFIIYFCFNTMTIKCANMLSLCHFFSLTKCKWVFVHGNKGIVIIRKGVPCRGSSYLGRSKDLVVFYTT